MTVIRRSDKQTVKVVDGRYVVVDPVMTLWELDAIEARIESGFRLKDDLDRLILFARRFLK